MVTVSTWSCKMPRKVFLQSIMMIQERWPFSTSYNTLSSDIYMKVNVNYEFWQNVFGEARVTFEHQYYNQFRPWGQCAKMNFVFKAFLIWDHITLLRSVWERVGHISKLTQTGVVLFALYLLCLIRSFHSLGSKKLFVLFWVFWCVVKMLVNPSSAQQ